MGRTIRQIMAMQCHRCKHYKPYKKGDCSIRKACQEGTVPKSAVVKMFKDGECQAFKEGK